MANKRKTLLVFLLIVLREAGPTAACSSSCPSDCDCERKGLTRVPQDLPATITTLRLGSNSITSLSQSDVSKYTKLKTLEFQNNQISIVNEQTFSNLTELQTLYLLINKITYLQSQTFSGLSQLRHLQLRQNQITGIEPGTFSNLPELCRLELYRNRLTKILPGTLKNLPKLGLLNLKSNRITNFDPVTITNLPKLASLDLSENQITNIGPGILKNLSNLYRLDLSVNQITNIDPGTFTNLPKLRVLELSSNKIANIDPGTFTNLTWLSLEGNPWHCDCTMANVKKAITRAWLSDLAPQILKNQIVCETPSGLHGKKLDSLNPDLLICEKPKIVSFENTKGDKLTQGETLHLVCEASGTPKPDITVTLPSKLIATADSSGRVTVELNGTITITNVTAADAGQYICTAANPGGSASDKLFVEVEKKPAIVSFKISDDTLGQGEALYLACEASGTPKPDITVTLPSGLNATVESGGRVTVGVNGTITITNVTAADAGQYICTATNPGGSASKKLFVVAQTTTSDSPAFNISSLVPTSPPIHQSEGNPTKFHLPLAIGIGTFNGVIIISSLVLAVWWVRRKKKAPVISAPTIDPPNTDSCTDGSGGQDRSLNPKITSSAVGTDEETSMPENEYEDPESLLAIGCPARRAVGSKEESVVCASKAASAQKPLTVHELENIVYGKDESGFDYEDMKPTSIPKKGEAATSHASYENTHVQETVHDTSHVTDENVDGNEAVLYASAQVIYGHDDDKAQSAASQSIYKTYNEQPESPGSQIIYGNDDQKAESSSPHAIYNNESEKTESPASQIIYGNDDQKAEFSATHSIYKNDNGKPESQASHDIYEAGDGKTAAAASCMIYEHDGEP